ncbi:MAG: helix-turn-helix transcriptional regulator [Elusimicrobiaceae bacterium]|nr:helix-turn-helix transcriptional regulator [Elusimicrobiaceae bacterium]
MGKPSTLKIHNNLSGLRKAKNITQEELATAVGVTRATMNYVENSTYLPSLELAFKLGMFFKMRIEDIFYCEGENS